MTIKQKQAVNFLEAFGFKIAGQKQETFIYLKIENGLGRNYLKVGEDGKTENITEETFLKQGTGLNIYYGG